MFNEWWFSSFWLIIKESINIVLLWTASLIFQMLLITSLNFLTQIRCLAFLVSSNFLGCTIFYFKSKKNQRRPLLRLSFRLRLLVTDIRGEARLLELGEPLLSRSLDLARVLELWGTKRQKHNPCTYIYLSIHLPVRNWCCWRNWSLCCSSVSRPNHDV